MAIGTKKLTPAEHLDRHIEENRIRANRWRAEYGDAGEAMGRFLIERFGLEALQETYDEYRRNRYSFMDDDFEDEDEHDLEDGKAHGREPN